MGGWLPLLSIGSSSKSPLLKVDEFSFSLFAIPPYCIPGLGPPTNDDLKWNVDTSFDPRLDHAVVGGVLRNALGNFICLFSSPIPFMEINSAEVYAIFRAIQISMNSEAIKGHYLTIVSDSSNAVQWCNLNNGGPWNLNFLLNYIRNARKSGLSLSIVHKGRSTNGVADALAKQGLSRKDEFLAWC